MWNLLCICSTSSFGDKDASTWSTVLEFMFSIIIGVCGLAVNYIFLKKLREEKRNTPPTRKGNVIEPIMSWYCFIQMIYWPYSLFYFWITFNEIIAPEIFNGWLCQFRFIKLGRTTIAYNSLFVAIIRYLYIVHHQKANQWSFKKVGRLFQVASVAIPVLTETVAVFTNSYSEFTTQPTFAECIALHQGLNDTDEMIIPKPPLVAWTMTYLPELLVNGISDTYYCITGIVLSNIIEGPLYFRIHQNISR